MYLYANNFIGGIGPSINATNMLELDLSTNSLTEPIPEAIGNMKNLKLLFLYFNKISGPIPASMSLLPNLQDIRLFNNMLSGPLPPELGKHSPLGNLEVSNNFLTGELPDTLCSNKNLYDLVLFNNSFYGELPITLGDCDTLDNIMLYNNHFIGMFPGSVWSAFPKLTNVMLQNNDFAGVLPTEISSNISRIEIGNNRFSGAIPTSATGLRVFKAENNWFSHGLPADMSKLATLTDLNLAGNQITGSIPPSIVALNRLTSLNLSGNQQISGPIPAAIGQLSMLTILDLANNSLVGDIPLSFNNLHLTFLNLTNNQLSGMVPATLQGSNYDRSFLGNGGLCVGRLDSGLPLQLCLDGDGAHSSSRRRRNIIVVIVVLISSVALAGSVAVVWLVIRSKKKNQRDVTSWKMTPFHQLSFTVHDVLTRIKEEDVIGRGGSGKVYRIHLGCQNDDEEHGGGGGDEATAAAISHHSTVAVKKIGNAGKPDANLVKEFEAEVTSLGGLRHDNIINLLCCISGDDTKLLVYEYMENGSLDRWLHRRGHHRAADDVPGPLDWPTRLSAAVDVARGLSYMHHDFTRPVIHRDVKCSNILLDCGFRAKIADFGLARILAKSGESEAASGVCGTFGYIAPEYVNRAKVSEKVDVYSFGVVLLELATGRGPQDGGAESGSCLVKWAAKRYRDGEPCADLVDGEIKDPAYLDDMVAMFELGVVCTAEDPASRPPMSEVLHRLLQCDQNRGNGVSGDEDGDAAKDVCGVGSLECIVEMCVRTSPQLHNPPDQEHR
ncbi:hypothetical protein QOZ80_2BG0161640 [Eleusine coracana subsp. coracana]|nr:hypothetical protein QOZ80_2BG0161640 [Eleusine coracana subsp. coracana]